MADDELLAAIRDAWNWAGLVPAAVVDSNAFGHVLVRDTADAYWLIIPEDVQCVPVAGDEATFDKVRTRDSFTSVWAMTEATAQATAALGPPPDGHRFGFQVPSVLGGEYEVSNYAHVPHAQQLRRAGELALKIKDLPDGATIELDWE